MEGLTEEFRGRSVAIFGGGRSGLGAARLARKLGARPTVVDERDLDPRISAELERLGASVRPRWNGDPSQVPAEIWVISPGVPFDHPSLVAARSAGLPVLGEVELAFRAAQGPILAVTGTNGKSTTTVMAWLCARALGFEAWLCGNIAGSGYVEMPLTEAVAQAAPGDVLVAEVSSFQLESVERFQPLSAAITQIRPDHLNRHRTMEAYAAAKNRIFAAMDASNRAVAPVGDPWVRVPTGPEVVWFGEEVGDARLVPDGLEVLSRRVPLQGLPIGPLHDRLNALAALCVATRLAADRPDAVEAAAEGLRNFRPLTHRLEELGARRGVRFVNASMCTNPAAVVAVSRALGGRQRLLVGGVSKQTPFAELGRHLASAGHAAYAYGRDGEAIASQLAEQGASVSGTFGSLREALQAAWRDAEPHEAIVLAPGCASFDEFRDFEDRGAAFRRWVEELEP
ncbi:MAG: UDP-N-acetylmuramoyl-L-alanine--D-glutamate ligase [Fimbriimonadales bacterium]|nr:UDP-N-acetylmuramoyl-L-alanine--D-glutamate ligase [Fimbriimonadales bacterium]